MTDEDIINERLRTVLELLDTIPVSSPEQGERILNEVTDMLRESRLLEAAARVRRREVIKRPAERLVSHFNTQGWAIQIRRPNMRRTKPRLSDPRSVSG